MFICPYKDVNGHQMVWLHSSEYILVFSVCVCFLKTEKDKQVWNDMGGMMTEFTFLGGVFNFVLMYVYIAALD